ncbi:unnamed protein product [Nyctereutes procyonoides]|uniref:(raccoon dog) hypothetical protein n=1 Tax=Nyctereutes procyonoides TaxID=34880 RepID=A0A811ZH77_NYCPR|nr:unnamed protein product [Nyctereutes procyonoides]CAD7688188.1 unnamed protein product [Nyctereutes procyonoides]
MSREDPNVSWPCIYGALYLQSCTQEILEEMVCGFNYSNSLDHDWAHQANKEQCCSRGENGKRESTLIPGEAYTLLTLKEGTMENFIQSLVPSFQDRNLSKISCMYQVFTTVQQVLSQHTLSPTLGTWLDQKLQDTWQSLHCACFEVKGACVHVKLHDWDLKCHAPLTLMPRELLQLTEAEAQSEGPPMEIETPLALFQPSSHVSEPASPPSAVPDLEQGLTSSSPCVPGPELQSVRPLAFLGIVTPALNTETEPTPAPEATCTWCVTPEHQLHEEKPGLMYFPPKLVADAVSKGAALLGAACQCLGSIWSKRNKPGNEHLACTVHATITQFNSMANCVISTCLVNPSMTAQDRAMVVEHCIKVAKGSYYPPDSSFSSLPMPLKSCRTTPPCLPSSALQSASVHCLKNTWAKVSRKSFQQFQKLRTEDNPQSRKLLIQVAGKVPPQWAELGNVCIYI